jgi:hypothetical protein
MGTRHGKCRRHDDGFDSDLCTCGCAEIHAFVTAKEIAGFLRDEVEGKTNIRALAHARAVNARAGQ